MLNHIYVNKYLLYESYSLTFNLFLRCAPMFRSDPIPFSSHR